MREFSSFRDPSGFVYYENGKIYRQINQSYKSQFDHLMNSGLYDELISRQLLVEHHMIDTATVSTCSYCVIQPDQIDFISYPYEWSFSQLKDAALATLEIHRCAITFGMILKDASAYNIQFVNGQPKLIDTLSFDFYQEGSPWVAYGQFCRHFLAPLFLMSFIDIRLSQLSRIYIDGLPIDLASKLLKGKGGGFAAKKHIHWHALAVSKHAQDGKISGKAYKIKINKFNFVSLIEDMIRTIERITLKGIVTEWADYYKNTNYSGEALNCKENIVSGFIEEMAFKNIWDFGANNGKFSRIALNHGASSVVAFDIDPIAVERNYHDVKRGRECILPLILDLTNPSPGIGFANRERLPVEKRRKPDCILALALIHHLAISNNLPLDKISEWMSEITENLIIEFVPKEDSQVQVLLATREDIFSNYNQLEFEKSLRLYFDILKAEPVTQSKRIIYLCKKRTSHE